VRGGDLGLNVAAGGAAVEPLEGVVGAVAAVAVGLGVGAVLLVARMVSEFLQGLFSKDD